jgi:hypothetical protein
LISSLILVRGRSQLGSFLSHGISFQIDFVSIVDNAIEDRIGDGGVLNEFMPVIYGKLAGDKSGAKAVAVIDEFQEIAALFCIEFTHSPIIQQQEMSFGDGGEEFAIAAISFGDQEILEESGDSQIEGGETFSASLVSECAGKKGFTGPCGAGNDEVMVLFDPVAGLELCDQSFIDPPGGVIIDIFDGSALPEPGLFEAGLEMAVFSVCDFPVDHQPEALLEGEGVDIGHLHLLFESPGHAGESKGSEVIQSGMDKHK